MRPKRSCCAAKPCVAITGTQKAARPTKPCVYLQEDKADSAAAPCVYSGESRLAQTQSVRVNGPSICESVEHVACYLQRAHG